MLISTFRTLPDFDFHLRRPLSTLSGPLKRESSGAVSTHFGFTKWVAYAVSISWVRFLEACFGFCRGVMVACMSDYRHKRHNVSSLLYHIVCPAKYRRVIFDPEVDTVLRDICLDIAHWYDIAFLEIGTEKDHVHFLAQSVPNYSPTKIVQIINAMPPLS